MAYFAISPCGICRGVFTFNPERVPSMRMDQAGRPDPNGQKEPICSGCMALLNGKRKVLGLPPFEILPGAYEPQGEPTDIDFRDDDLEDEFDEF